MTGSTGAEPNLLSLVNSFYNTVDDLAFFAPAQAERMPPAYRELLAHNGHMTETVERYYQGPVDVRVLDKRVTDSHYARKILLARHTDGLVVQFGIMRVSFASIGPAVRREIEAENTPLGRILIQHNVLREVQLSALWRVESSSGLAVLFQSHGNVKTFGRTAMIYLNDVPAVELLEIVTPVEDPGS